MSRDTDYAAIAIRNAVEEKFGRQTSFPQLEIEGNERTITVRDGDRRVEGTRDNLLAALRRSATYADFWEVLETDRNIR
jgi:hypothetical protein